VSIIDRDVDNVDIYSRYYSIYIQFIVSKFQFFLG